MLQKLTFMFYYGDSPFISTEALASTLPTVDLPIAVDAIYIQLYAVIGELFSDYKVEEGSMDLGEVLQNVDLRDVRVYSLDVARSLEADGIELTARVDLGSTLAVRIIFPLIPVENLENPYLNLPPEKRVKHIEAVSAMLFGTVSQDAEPPRIKVGQQLELAAKP